MTRRVPTPPRSSRLTATDVMLEALVSVFSSVLLFVLRGGRRRPGRSWIGSSPRPRPYRRGTRTLDRVPDDLGRGGTRSCWVRIGQESVHLCTASSGFDDDEAFVD